MNISQLETCIDKYGKDIFAFCCHMTGNRSEAEELYQDTFLKAMEILTKIDYENNPKSFLLSVALRLWKNKKRKWAWRMRIAPMVTFNEVLMKTHETAFTEVLPEANGNKHIICKPAGMNVGMGNAEGGNMVEEEFLQKELNEFIQSKVAELDEKYRIPIYLYYTDQLSVEEIGKMLKLPTGTVKSRLHKARKMLKKELEVVMDEI